MKVRYVLPVVVLALAVLFVGGMASAAENTAILTNSATATSNSNNVNQNRNENIVHVRLEIGDLELGSTTVTATTNNTRTNNQWDNRARIGDAAFENAVGINQASVVSGMDNLVRQGAFAVTVQAHAMNIGNVTDESLF